MYVSAGKRGLQLELAPADLIRLARAQVAAVSI
jgi:prolyl-tRNA editing enzyme YbaK/EbsC (Cys-tRNA(Pro) deacylase)